MNTQRLSYLDIPAEHIPQDRKGRWIVEQFEHLWILHYTAQGGNVLVRLQAVCSAGLVGYFVGDGIQPLDLIW